MSFAHAFNTQSRESEAARRQLVERLTACLAELDLIGAHIAAAHLSACIETINADIDHATLNAVDSQSDI